MRVSCRALFIHFCTEAVKTKNWEHWNITSQHVYYVVKFNYPYEMCDVPGVQVDVTEKKPKWKRPTDRDYDIQTNEW